MRLFLPMRVVQSVASSFRLPVILLLACMSAPSYSQSNVSGWVYGQGPSGSQVLLEGIDTGLRFDADVGDSGLFRIPSVPVGRYRISNSQTNAKPEITVSLGEGTFVEFAAAGAGDATVLDAVQVTGAAIAPIDIARTETSFDISEIQFDAIPMPRDVTSVALLAPGSILGDNGFGRLASLGGSTVSENQYFVNGFNISDLRTRLGPSTVPFEFFQQFQVKTGGISSEFGRTTGGVINSVTKRGTNVWEVGANTFWEPDFLRGSKNDVRGSETAAQSVRALYYYGQDELDVLNANIFGGGPILKDKVFFYAMAQLRNTQENRVDRQTRYTRNFRKGDTASERSSDDPFYALKLDWNIVNGHNLELTHFSDERDLDIDTYTFDRVRLQRSPAPTGSLIQEFGGDITIARYTGLLTDFFKASVLYGQGEAASSQLVLDDTCPNVRDQRPGAPSAAPGCFSGNPIFDDDKRIGYRLDFELDLSAWDLLGSHVIKFGADREENESFDKVKLSGDFAYIVQTVAAGALIDQGSSSSTVPVTAAGDYVEVNSFSAGGTFDEELEAFYVEDQWSPISGLTLSLGLRQESFKNTFPTGQVYVDLEGDVAPRLGVSWDFMGEGESKVYANYGRYYIPIGTQSSVRNGGGEFNQFRFYEFAGYSTDRFSRPILGPEVGGPQTFANGQFTDVRTLASPNIDPSFQDELIFGYESKLPDSWIGPNATGGVRFIYRELKETVEDIAIDLGLNSVATSNPGAFELSDCDEDGADDDFACGFDFYFLTNPGQGSYTVFLPVNTNGDFINTHDPLPTAGTTTVADFQPVVVSNSTMNYPKPERKYYAVELSFERLYDRNWFMNGSYTWSQSFGNYEGFVNSTIEQDDVAITQDFDQPGLTEHAHGFLANDRRHKFKLFGARNLGEEFQLGAAFFMQSGRPISALGFYPDANNPARAYNTFSFYRGGLPSPRGTAGRTEWLWELNVSLNYSPLMFDKKLTAGLDLLNVFDNKSGTEANERAESAAGVPNPAFGEVSDQQDPFRARLRLEYKF